MRVIRMTLRIRNRWKYRGDDRWDWEAFLEDDGSGQLATVDSVEYILHPTFSNPVREVSSAHNQFKLKTNGWGTFELKAFVNFNDGSRKKLTHNIELYYDPDTGVST